MATTEAKYQPAVPRSASWAASLTASVLALALCVLLALYLGSVPAGETPRLVSWIAAGIAAVLVVLRIYARRRMR